MVNVGSAVAYLTLDRSGFKNSLHSAGADLRNFTNGTGEAGGRLKSLGNAMTTTGAAMTKKMTVPLAGAGAAMAKVAGDFEQSSNKVNTIADTNVTSMKDLNEGILKISNNTGESASGLNEALYQTISATNDTKNALGYVDIASKAAKGGFTDTATSVDGLTSVMNAYGMKGKDSMQKVSDMMLQTQNLGKTTFGELSQSLYNVIPTASSLGVGFDQVSAAMSTITSQGTPTSVATTQLRQLFVELSKASGKTAKTFKKLSGKNFADFIKSGGTVQDALKIMEKGAKNNGVALKDMFGSVEAGNAAMQLTGNGAKKFASDLKGMRNSSGATEKAYKKMSKGMNDSLKKLKTSLMNLGISLGSTLAPIIAKIAKGLQKFVDIFNKLPSPIKKFIVHMGLIVATAGPLILVSGKIVRSIGTLVGAFNKIKKIDKVVKTFKKVGRGIKGVVKTFSLLKKGATIFKLLPALLSPPILIAVAIIAGLGLIIYAVMKHWNKCKAFAKAFANGVKKVFSLLGKALKVIVNGWKLIFKGFIGILKWVWKMIKLYVKIWIGIFKGVAAILKAVVKGWMSIFKGLGKLGKILFNIGKYIIKGLINGIKAKVGKIFGIIGHIANKIKNGFKSILGIHSPSRVFAEYGGFIGEGLIEGIEKQEGAIDTKFKGIANKIKGIGNVKPKFAGIEGLKGLDNVALSGAYAGSNADTSNIGNSNRSVGITQNVKMYVTIPNASKEGATKLAGEFKNTTEHQLKDGMTELFMKDVLRD